MDFFFFEKLVILNKIKKKQRERKFHHLHQNGKKKKKRFGIVEMRIIPFKLHIKAQLAILLLVNGLASTAYGRGNHWSAL